MKKKMSLVLAILLLIMVPIQAMAVSDGFSDMPNDWSTKAFNEAIDNGLIKGYEGQVFPKKNLTRAEMAAIMNRALKSETEASLSGYVDVAPGSWQHDEMSKAVGSKIFQGSGNRLHPNDMITREEAFVVLSRVMNIRSSAQNKMAFYDLGSISSWAREEMNGMLNTGYVKGSNGFINPKAPITRAEFVQLMSNVVQTYIDSPETHKSVKPGNVVVNVPGATLKDVTITGDLIIGDGVGEGEVTLDDVEVTGRLLVRAGGENSIILKGNSTVGSISVVKNGKVVRILNETKKDLPEVSIEGESDVVLAGLFKNVHVKSEKVIIHIKDGEIKNINMNGADSELKVDKGSTVEDVKIDAPKIVISGLGKVEDVSVESTGSDSKITTPNTIIFVERGAKDVTGTGNEGLSTNKEYQNGTSDRTDARPVEDTTDRDSGGSGGSTRPPVVRYSVDYRVVGEGGAIATSVATDSAITSGTDLVFEATAEEGYEIKEWRVNSVIKVVEGNKLTLDIDRNTVVTVEFAPVAEEPAIYALTINATPEGSIIVLKDSLDIVVEAADIDGSYGVEAGNYTYTVSKDGYVTAEDAIVVSEDMVVNVTLELVAEPSEPTFDITFNIAPVDAVVVFTDSLGNPIYAVGGVYTVEAGVYSYEVSKEGYYTADDTFTVSVDTDITITLHEVEPVAPVAIVGVSNISLMSISFNQPTFIGDVPLQDVSSVIPKLDLLQLLFADPSLDATVFNEANIVVNSTETVLTIEMYEDAINRDLFYALDHPDGGYVGDGNGVYRKDVTLDLSRFNNSANMTCETVFEPFKIKFDVPVVHGVAQYDMSISGVFQTQAQRDTEIDPVMDTISPEMVSAQAVATLLPGETFVLDVEASDENLYELEIDHSFEGILPEFSVYADRTNPYGTEADRLQFESNGVNVDYRDGMWTIDFGPAITDVFVAEGGVTFYLVVKDFAGNAWGSMSPPTVDNTLNFVVERVAPAPDSYITGSGTLTDEGTFLSASFTWGSVNGVGSLEETISGSYGYYTDGAYLRFQVENTTGAAVSFADVFETLDDGNNATGGMTLQTNGGNINDMDGSNREKADWGIAGFEGFETSLPGTNSLYYGVIQNATVGTKTVGFGSGESRAIDMTLTPRADLLPGTYTVIVDVMQQNGSALGDSMVYTFTK